MPSQQRKLLNDRGKILFFLLNDDYIFDHNLNNLKILIYAVKKFN